VASLRDQIPRVCELNPANGVDLRGSLKACEKFFDYDYSGYIFVSTLRCRVPEVYFDDKKVILKTFQST